MLGTAFEQAGVLLVEQPGPWGHAGLTDSRFDPEIAKHVEGRAREAGLRPMVIRRHGRTEPGMRRQWAVRLPGSDVVFWGTYAEDGELLALPLDYSVSTAGVADREPSYFVCAHSKRDQCCAVFGRPIATELERLRPGRVWECSHTGGHRFAPIVLTLPAGALYGRFNIADLPGLVAATDSGRTVPDHLRGVIGNAAVVQAALAYAQQQTGQHGLDAFAVAGRAETESGRWVVELSAGDTAYDVTVEVNSVLTPYASCGKPTAKPERELRAVGISSH